MLIVDDHFAQFFPAICAGLGLFLAGVANLLLPRRLLWARVAVTLGALAVALAAAATIDQPGTIAATLALLAIGLFPWLLLGSGRVIARVTALMAMSQRLAARSILLIVVGLGMAIHSIMTFERADEEAIEASIADLERAAARVPLMPSREAWAATDLGTRIVLKEAVDPHEGAALDVIESRLLQNGHLDDQVIRRGHATEQSNCHGWVFTRGRYFLSPEDVELILAENGYREVADPRPGDLAIYRTSYGIAHTAIVRYVSEGQPVMIEGKWSIYGVFLHPVDRSPYGTEYSFYRSSRHGHLLIGLDGRAFE